MSGARSWALVGRVGEALLSQRVRCGFALEHAAAVAHVDPERLAAAEGGELVLLEPELENLAEVYGVHVTAFFGGRTTPPEYLFNT
jgi:hypothetical protein